MLEIDGALTLRADRPAVWAALHDPARLRLCVPGCDALRRVTSTRFDVTARVAIGPVSVPFEGQVEIVGSEPPDRLRLRGAGQGGIAGSVEGRVEITLVDTPLGCRLAYRLEAEPTGPLAAPGTYLLTALARLLVERFGDGFAIALGAPFRAGAGARGERRDGSPR